VLKLILVEKGYVIRKVMYFRELYIKDLTHFTSSNTESLLIFTQIYQ